MGRSGGSSAGSSASKARSGAPSAGSVWELARETHTCAAASERLHPHGSSSPIPPSILRPAQRYRASSGWLLYFVPSMTVSCHPPRKYGTAYMDGCSI
ncbi:hypothetical protein U9M48_023757 [Paspalum notatum var. saurae]|uniref:Uncharacterized protein n=1 Tax=Paspalum notatum var. saurae TaxID=547442 RepID=A0AAQ3TM40_PASNO